MNPDEYIEGTFSEDNPINQIEVEIDEDETDLEIAERQIKSLKQILNYKIVQLKKLAEIEETLKTFGYFTYEEQQEKNEILNQYL